MGCGASKGVTQVPSLTPSRQAQDLQLVLRLDGENVKSVTPNQIETLLATKLRMSSERFTVKASPEVPNIMHCTIHPQSNLNTAMLHMAERQAVQMIGRQVKLKATEGQLALEKVIVTEVALPGERLEDEDGMWADVLFRETIREVWNQADVDRNGYLDMQEFKNLMLSDNIGLGLQEKEVEEILSKVDVNSDQKVVFSEFLPLCKELLCAIYAKLNVETIGDWCQLWSIKTGLYYFNKRSGKCQYEEPAGFIPLPKRQRIQAAPSEEPIPETDEGSQKDIRKADALEKETSLPDKENTTDQAIGKNESMTENGTN
eukprot:m.13659 g.13659  ORF g.13659 m.13659 type:complete len:316 (+) comp25145_c0_seq1:119-1066(+)